MIHVSRKFKNNFIAVDRFFDIVEYSYCSIQTRVLTMYAIEWSLIAIGVRGQRRVLVRIDIPLTVIAVHGCRINGLSSL